MYLEVRLKGAENLYRVRVGDYRVLYRIFDEQSLIVLLQVVRRSESTYR